MMKIDISTKKHPGTFCLVDDEDYDEVCLYKWFPVFTKDNKRNPYIITNVKKNGKYRIMYLHRFIMKPNKNMQVDHINHDTFDNRKENLRICTNSQNQFNKKIMGGVSEYKGVSWHNSNKLWRARVGKNRKQILIGYFKNETDAAIAYNKAAIERFGEFACLNKIGEKNEA